MSNNNCQSCNMPLCKDKNGGGTENDGTKSELFCSYCYKDGQFILPDISVKEMQERVDRKLKELKIPSFISWYFTRKIPKLERWK